MIRKILTATCAALALTGGLIASASASDITPTGFTFLGLGADAGGLDTTATFTNAGSYTAGQSIDELFLVFVPAFSLPSQVSFDAYASANSVQFTGIDFGVFDGTDYDANGNPTGSYSLTSLALGTDGLSKYFVFGQSADFVDSGIYYFELTGTALSDGAAFSGDALTTAIPEPTNAALLLAGLGVFATLARRRKQTA
jgi:hypothetical protein